MIYYNSNTINDWNFGDDNIIKVYKHGAVCYYKVTSGDTPTPVQEPCFAVVDDITQYQDTEFEDIFNKADEKWYKLNNLSQYEEYGVYGSGRNITYYEGKLTIDNGYEYQYSGASWNNVGEVSGSSRLPQGYTEVDYVENTTQAYLNLGVYPYNSSSNSYAVEAKFSSTQGTNQFEYLFSCEQGNLSPYVGFVCRWQTTRPRGLVIDGTNYTSKNITNNQDGTSGFTITSNLTNATNTTPITLFCGLQGSTVWRNGKGKVYSFKVTINDNLVRDMIPCKRDNDNVVGMYDIVNDVFYYPPNYTSYQLVAGSATGTTIYPIYYDVIQDPPNNLSFSSMTEAEEYECPWVGMNATIDGVNYVFSGDSQSGYEWVENQHSLPDVPFVLNYNAKQYNASTKALLKTEGQLADVDAVITAGTPTVNDGYLTIASSTRATISGYQNYFNRSNSTPNLTIISKQRTDGSNCHMFANRDSNYNWMYRCYSDMLTLHGSGEQGFVAVTTQPVIESVRVNSSRLATYNNYTNNTSSTYSNFNYGGTNSGNFALFAGYAQSTGEWFVGDFYWVYMCQGTLTDEQVQQVIDYNENL